MQVMQEEVEGYISIWSCSEWITDYKGCLCRVFDWECSRKPVTLQNQAWKGGESVLSEGSLAYSVVRVRLKLEQQSLRPKTEIWIYRVDFAAISICQAGENTGNVSFRKKCYRRERIMRKLSLEGFLRSFTYFLVENKSSQEIENNSLVFRKVSTLCS
jgi:hypothetical protein